MKVKILALACAISILCTALCSCGKDKTPEATEAPTAEPTAAVEVTEEPAEETEAPAEETEAPESDVAEAIVEEAVEPEGDEILEFSVSVDYVYVNGKSVATGGSGAAGECYEDTESYEVSRKVGIGGWCVCEDGIASYQFSVNDGPFQECSKVQISERPDLSSAGIPYENGHSTAGYTIYIQADRLEAGDNDIVFRAVTTTGDYFDMYELTDVYCTRTK